MIHFDNYFHDGGGPSDGWEVLNRVRREHPNQPDAPLAEIISATSGSPPDTRLAVQALEQSGVSVEGDIEHDALDVGRARHRTNASSIENAEDVLEKVDEQVEVIGVPAEGVDAEEAGEAQRREALAVEFAAGSPAVLYLRE